MRRFSFRLEPVLSIRKYREREAELALAEITGICIGLRNQIEARKGEISGSYGMAEGGLDLHYLQIRELYRKRLQDEIDELSTKLADREKERAEKTRTFLAASRDRKVLDKLRERKSQEYYAAQFAEEIKTVDDISGGMGIRAAISASDSSFGGKE